MRGPLAFAEARRCDILSPAIDEDELDYDLQVYADRFIARMAGVWRKGVANGVCLIIHRRVFDTIGFFDGDPGASGYDDEFFPRARRAGLKLAATSGSFMHHFSSVTQKGIEVERGLRLQAGLGDRDYCSKKYGLT